MTPNRRRALTLLALAAVAGIVAGTAGVYFRGAGDSNVTAAAVNCADAVATASKVAPLAKGEVAAFRVATAPESFTDLSFKAPDGSPTTLASLSGKVVLVNLWATWCVPCRAEMPALDKLQTAMGGDGFTVATINLDVQKPEAAKAFMEQIGVSHLPLYSDPTMGVFNDLKRRGLAIGLPTTLLVDGKGCRIGIVEGPAEWDSADARALIEAALPKA
ncbi:MAG TPA: TlpA disulfide reductase family protein [Bauldia sp.]|nr:TlpA disulfide reductase family protein [Bauldia sp.]